MLAITAFWHRRPASMWCQKRNRSNLQTLAIISRQSAHAQNAIRPPQKGNISISFEQTQMSQTIVCFFSTRIPSTLTVATTTRETLQMEYGLTEEEVSGKCCLIWNTRTFRPACASRRSLKGVCFVRAFDGTFCNTNTNAGLGMRSRETFSCMNESYVLLKTENML